MGGWAQVFGETFATNTYTGSSEDFANPERGFYIQANSSASHPSAVPTNLADYRINGKRDPNNSYTAKISLLLRLYYLDSFINSPISSNFLTAIQADFNSIRAQGFKAILRFAYNDDDTRPFDEPSKARILEHINQLKPVLAQNSDVIAVFQHGLIAAWGEGYYTDVFYTNGQATTQNWLDRAEVIAALLDALPAERMIQVRVPQHKQKFLFGPTAPTTSAPLSPSEAFTGTGAARIGFHNDCYLSDSTDMGTFSDYDFGSGTTLEETASLRNYVAMDSRYVPVGGETCVLNPPTDDCASAGGGADSDMALSHYSYLNQGYNAQVNDDWAAQGCIESIKRRLGYRLHLISGTFRTEARAGQIVPIELQFRNTGFAAPFNPRGVELVLLNTTTGQKFFAELSRNTDIRRWLPGSDYSLAARLSLPSDLPLGAYDLYLHLPDPADTLYGKAPFSMRLANSNAVSQAGTVLGELWDPTNAYHRLHHTLNINLTATNSEPDGSELPVRSYSAFEERPIVFVDPGQPADQFVDAGQSVSFTAAITGSNPLTYQWLRNGTNIPGATNPSLTITNAQESDGGSYALRVVNPVSTNSSRAAVLTVRVPATRTVSIDGSFADWQGLWPVHSSPSNSPAATNLKDIYICNDAEYIYMMVTAWSPTVLLSSYNNFYFDTDNNAGTGYFIMGGSDLLIQSGTGYQQKVGVFNAGAINNLDYLCAPSGSASQFEFRFSRQSINAGDATPVIRADVLHLCFDAENSSYVTINRVPTAGTISYNIAESPPGPLTVTLANSQLNLQWAGTALLQTCTSLDAGSWTSTAVSNGPWSVPATGSQQYFRLKK